jgi:hypothetical protein
MTNIRKKTYKMKKTDNYFYDSFKIEDPDFLNITTNAYFKLEITSSQNQKNS